MVALCLCIPPCAVAFHVFQVIIPRRFEFIPDESQAEHPASEGVGFVFRLLWLRACEAYLLSKAVDRKAELDERFCLARMKTVFLIAVRDIILESSELDCSVSVEKAVQVAEMVSGGMVMACSSVGASLVFVPDVFKLAHGFRLLPVDLLQEAAVDHLAVASHAVAVNPDRLYQLAFMRRHDVDQVTDGLRGVPLSGNVYMDPASPSVITLHACLAEDSDESLQKLHVGVGQDRGDHFAFILYPE